MLLSVDPIAVVDVAVLEDVLPVAVPSVLEELADVLVALVLTGCPPELTEALLHAFDVITFVSVSILE